MRHLLLAAMLLAFGTAAHAEREWTVMCYFVADDNKSADLEAGQVRNLDELSERGSTDQCALLVQMDRSNKTNDFLRSRYAEPDYAGASRYAVARGKWNPVAKLGEVNMGDPRTLLDFMQWGARNYPAKHYALIINGHGSGLLSWNGAGSVSDPQPGRVDLPNLSNFIGYDYTDGDCLTIFELEQVLARFNAPRGRKLDVVALDGCYAGCLEVLYQLRDVTEVFVAAASLVAGHGFRYTAIVEAIAANPAISGAQLGAVMDKTYIDRADGDYVLGTFLTAGADELASAVSELSREMSVAGREVGRVAIPNLTQFANDKYWDLERILRSILTGTTGFAKASNAAQVTAAANRSLAALRNCRSDMWYRGDYAAKKIGGLSIYWPDKDTYRKYHAFYKATAFAKGALWDEYLDWRELNQ